MSKSYQATVVAIDCFGDAIVQLPDALVEELDWRVGDKLDYEQKEDKSIVIKNLTKEERNATNS
jgi:antitoxin component of MazEF toxin-antitoxin module